MCVCASVSLLVELLDTFMLQCVIYADGNEVLVLMDWKEQIVGGRTIFLTENILRQ